MTIPEARDHARGSTTRTRILDAATELFHARGVHAVGVADIAASAGASKLSLYRHFGSKDDLVRAVVVERSERIHHWLRRRTEDAPAGPARVLSVFDLLIDWFARPGYRGCAVVNASVDTRGDPGVTGPAAREHMARYRRLLEERIGELDPPVADVADLARWLLLLVEGATTVTAIEGASAGSAGHDARAIAETLLRTAARAPRRDQDSRSENLTDYGYRAAVSGVGETSAGEFRTRLRAAGLRRTAPRVAVLEWLSAHPHSTVEQLRRGLDERGEPVSEQGLYDVLAACAPAGLVRKIEPAGSPARYETRTGHHHHLVCRACAAIEDVDCVVGAAPCLTPGHDGGYTLDEAEVVFWGRCRDCREPAQPRSVGARA